MKKRTMQKRAAGPNGAYLVGRTYQFPDDLEEKLDEAGAFVGSRQRYERAVAPTAKERADDPRNRGGKRR